MTKLLPIECEWKWEMLLLGWSALRPSHTSSTLHFSFPSFGWLVVAISRATLEAKCRTWQSSPWVSTWVPRPQLTLLIWYTHSPGTFMQGQNKLFDYKTLNCRDLFHTVHGVLKATILKWFAIPFSSESPFASLTTLKPWLCRSQQIVENS